MHEYPRNPTFDSVSERRASALGGFGFTQRQREFLVTVMVHAGCFLERQYCAFTGTARGQNSREFVARLVARGFARAIEPGPVRRGRLYHVHHKPLYEPSHPWWLHDRAPRSSASIAATCRERVSEAALCAAVDTGAGVAVAEPTMA